MQPTWALALFLFIFLLASKQALCEHHRSMDNNPLCRGWASFSAGPCILPGHRVKAVKVVGVQLATVFPFPHLSLMKEAELRTQILKKKKKNQISHKAIRTRLHPILKKAQVRETEFCLIFPGLASSLRKCTKPLGESKHQDWLELCLSDSWLGRLQGHWIFRVPTPSNVFWTQPLRASVV